ncbi:phosphoglycerate mutase family protein [Brevundimonas viscosa]|uniref:Histidine phosphatase superfamily (Branch 1) n=1 Tax=Brevundimonas viscosa TaxID=871741 RepID=A0A1I6S202_9CAUL|nr:phosphoglycerate mutase family protein [Brevundimonas viscosa]SFS70991.1 Histidine phosphatase superfamily (branch 1) [Brevundimonas viscosa]
MKRLLLATVASLLTATSAMAQTVYIVRHAEKADAPGNPDPALSEAGQARAALLSEVLRDAHPVLVLTSPMQRTIQTAAPTAAYHSALSEPVSLEGGGAAHVAATAARVRALPADATVLIVGHSNTVPLIARALGYAEAADMPECEYDRMTVLHLMDGHVHGEVSRYGAASTC